MLTKRFDDALVFASSAHRNQIRKGTDIPYVSHLLGVASIAIELGADEDQAIAALLHDAVEDQGGAAMLATIRNRYGDRVAEIVADCTDSDTVPKPPWRARKEAYLASLAKKPQQSLLVSLADKTHNARAILDDVESSGDQVWERFTGGRDGSLWYYRALADVFRTLMPSHPGASRLAAVVDAMWAAAGEPAHVEAG